jgi:glycosyltransferase involved in cell wall biosynthesis
MALISVIIPVYNHALELGDCLRSLEKQTFTDFEVIVVDDGSKDDVEKRFADYHGHFPYQFVRLETNQGAPVARNHGFQLSKGEYVLFLDADAVLQPNMLNELIHALQVRQEVGFAYSSFYFGKLLRILCSMIIFVALRLMNLPIEYFW